jgi:DNA-binding response OmpR family regulator
MLEQAGFDVITASDGVIAVDKLAANPDQVDAVLLDMTMPHMSGEETYDAMMAIRPGLPVVFASGFSEQDASVKGGDRHALAYLQKPYRLKDLITALNRVGVSV